MLCSLFFQFRSFLEFPRELQHNGHLIRFIVRQNKCARTNRDTDEPSRIQLLAFPALLPHSSLFHFGADVPIVTNHCSGKIDSPSICSPELETFCLGLTPPQCYDVRRATAKRLKAEKAHCDRLTFRQPSSHWDVYFKRFFSHGLFR